MKDIVLTYHKHFKTPRVLPTGYVKKTIPIIQKGINYFAGEVDAICHLCGLERIAGEYDNKDGHKVRQTDWEYFLVETYDLEDWEKLYRKNVRHLDSVLKKRFSNRLPSRSGIIRFYHEVEINSYMSASPLDEISVGISLGVTTSRHKHWIPNFDIQTRSISGEEKECRKTCEELMGIANQLFNFSSSQNTFYQEFVV